MKTFMIEETNGCKTYINLDNVIKVEADTKDPTTNEYSVMFYYIDGKIEGYYFSDFEFNYLHSILLNG